MGTSALAVAFGLSIALNVGLLAHAMLLGAHRCLPCQPCPLPTLAPDPAESWQPPLKNAARAATWRRLKVHAATLEEFDYNAHMTPQPARFCENASFPPFYMQLRPGMVQMCPGLNDSSVLDTVEGCGSMFLCSLSPRWRHMVRESEWYENWAAHHIPGTDIPLLVPIQKIFGYPHPTSRPIEPPADGGPQVFPPWPQRKDVRRISLERLRNGTAFEICRKKVNVRVHWFCSHLSPNYGADHRHAVALMQKSNVFERQDVRLVFDLAGSVGAFAEALHHYYGDRIVCITGDSFITTTAAGERGANLEWPSQRILAAKGLPSVMIDGVSFLPFGESTLDALHTSWFFHHGVPWTTLWEMYRVVRPGGFLILRSFPAWTVYKMWGLYHTWAKSMKMRNVFYAKVGRIGSIQIYQLPLTKEWLRGQENHNTSSSTFYPPGGESGANVTDEEKQ